MEYKTQLITGTIKNIYKNIILDVELDDGNLCSAFCPEKDFKNQLYRPGGRVYLTRSGDIRRRVSHICQMVGRDNHLIFVNYKYKNTLFAEAFQKGVLQQDFGRYQYIREIKRGETLKCVNFELLNDAGERAYIYVVNIFNRQEDDVVFPSTINFFELEMFEEMRRLRENGSETFVCLLVPREDCQNARFVWGQDPIAAAKIYDEVKNGLKFCCYGCNVSETTVAVTEKKTILY